MPAGTKVEKAEQGIRKSAEKRGFKGRRLARYVYGRLNNMGMMRGNRPTKAGMGKVKTVMG